MASENESAVIVQLQDLENRDENSNTGKRIVSSNIHKAARYFDHERLRELLEENEFLVNITDEISRTPLHAVLENGFLGHLNEDAMILCIQVLMRFGANINDKDKGGKTPLHLSVENVFPLCARLMILDYNAHCTIEVATQIANVMPHLLIEIFDSGVSLIEDEMGNAMVKLDWRPILQFEPKDILDVNKKFKHIQKETQFLYNLLDVKEANFRNQILKHPLVEAFLHLKNEKVISRFLIFYLIGFFYPIVYMVFIYFLYFEKCKFEANFLDDGDASSSTTITPTKKVRCEITIGITIGSYLLAIVIAAWALIEIYMQLRVDRRYLKSWRTWVIRVTIVVMGVTLWPGLQFNDVYNISFQYPIASIGIFLAWVLFLIQIGSYRKFSIYLEMLVKILLSVIKITLMFLPLFIGFFMGFNLMFQNMNGIFSYIMMTVDVGSEAYTTFINDTKDTALWFEILAYSFCSAFIVIIVIVFMNFLLALSIKDVQILKGQAKFASTARQISNLFVVDLIDPYSVLIPRNAKDKDIWSFKYYPSEDHDVAKLSKEIKMEILLVLKKKKMQRFLNETRAVENEAFRNVKDSSNFMASALMRRIDELEKKLDSLSNIMSET